MYNISDNKRFDLFLMPDKPRTARVNVQGVVYDWF